jgi:hypothetical protein
MRTLMILLSATAALLLGGLFWVAQATPLTSSISIPSQHYSPIGTAVDTREIRAPTASA